MKFITVNPDNIEKEHICCAISDIKGETCVSSKKAWMKDRFKDGLVFRRLDARSKAFIEYLPAENAWQPITAQGYLHINCFWVSGQFQGKGFGGKLLDLCVLDAKNADKEGLTIVSSVKKKSFLPDPNYMKYKGFIVADTAAPFFVLYYLPFKKDAPVPLFKECAKSGRTDKKGLTLYYSDQCPHAGKYAELAKKVAMGKGADLVLHKIETTADAQNAPSPFTSYSLFYNGEFVTNEILSEKKVEKFLSELGF